MKESWRVAGIVLVLFVSGLGMGSCSEVVKQEETTNEANVIVDGGVDGGGGDGGSSEAASESPPDVRIPTKALPTKWETGLPGLDVSGESRYRFVRSIIHLHSVYSHDACDGNPHVDGKKNLPCLQRLRDALCQDAIDVAFLTEHKAKMAEGDAIEQMVLYLDGDEKLMAEGAIIGNRFRCQSGHEVTVFPGAENELMPVGLQRHPTPASGQTLSELYGASSPEAIDHFKAAGAAVLLAHTEAKPVDYLLTHALHGIEIFNLHAVLDPRKRGADLGLNAEEAIGALYTFIRTPTDMPHPDLAFLGFHQRIPVYLEKWDAVLAKKMLYGFGGTDAHENVLRTPMSDGQRPDSYARMMRWFSNHLMVVERSVKAYRDALFAGRNLLVFEVLGTPTAFSFFAETTGGERVEMGATTTQKIKSIQVIAEHPYRKSEAPVHSKIKLVRIDASGSKVVAEGEDQVALQDPPPGTYRVEVDITPLHLKKLLTAQTMTYLKAYPWIYSNPIRLE